MENKEYPTEDMLPLEELEEEESFLSPSDDSVIPEELELTSDSSENPEMLPEEEDWLEAEEEYPEEPAETDLDDPIETELEESSEYEEESSDEEASDPAEEEEDPLDLELMEVSQLLEEQTDTDEKFLEKENDQEDFSNMVQSAPQKKPIPTHDRPARKGRPRRKKGEGLFGIPNILATAVWLAMILVIGVTLGRMLWVCAADVLAFGREDRPVTITIYESDTMDDITQKLHQNNLIRYPGLFKLYARFAVDEGEIAPGIWDLNTRYDYHALVSMMSPSSNRTVIEIMIPEGYSCRQIFALLEENKVCTAQDLAAYAANGELDDYWFLEGVTRGEENCLEGFLFPDTYQFYTNDSPRNVLQKMLNNFGNRYTEEMRGQLVMLNQMVSDMMRKDGRSQEYIDAHQLTMRDVVIIASMIEKETSSAEEGYTIASVIYNRLFFWGSTPAYLNIDATMVYALGGKTNLTAEDLKIDHPYNTYLYTGLTPGPISNPGLASLKAALYPKESPYYYYVLDPSTGSHKFSKTYEEHQAFIKSMGG